MPVNKLKFKFEAEKAARALPVLTGVLAFGLLLGVYLTVFMPKLGRLVAGGQYDLGPYQTAVASEQAYHTSLKAQIATFNSLNPVQREKALNLVPPEVDFPGLLVQVSRLCDLHQVSCPSIDVVSDETVLVGNRKSARLTLNVMGTDYAGMKSFLLDIERSRRIFDVESVIFSPASRSMSVSIRTYFLTDQKPVKAKAPVAVEAGE